MHKTLDIQVILNTRDAMLVNIIAWEAQSGHYNVVPGRGI